MSVLSIGFALGFQLVQSLYEIEVTTIENSKVSMKDFAGKVMLIVNTASKCGFTSQYEGLQEVYDKYKDRGLVVLGFPSNDFMGQEPGSDEEIQKFCKSRFGVTFPLFKKAAVKGKDMQPVYKYLTEQSPQEFQGDIGWNFVKFVVDRKGKVIGRFSSMKKPTSSDVTDLIEKALAEKAG